VSLYTAVKGFLDDIPVADVKRFEKDFLSFMVSDHQDVLQSIRDTKDLVADNEAALKAAIEKFKKSFATSV
jgi:F-type H+-transporting ATPase subunit alpha